MKPEATKPSSGFRKIYGHAAVIAAITLLGLLSALLGDNVWDGLSWIALAIPLAIITWKYSRAPRIR